jgi:threonine synthase
MGKVISLKCRECGHEHSPIKIAACEKCFAPLDVQYDLDSINLRKSSFEDRVKNIWRYKELLPIENKDYIVDMNVGYTPLIKAERLGEKLGLAKLYVKNDAVNPTYSFKDRPAEIAISKALEFGDKAVGCASTGNLAAAVAAHAAKAGLACFILAPNSIEPIKFAQIAAYGPKIITINGTYDDANKLAVIASAEFGWNIANITSRPYYVEGSKTIALEVCEQLNWQTPDHIIIPVASGALLCAINRGFNQFERLGLINENKTAIHGAQAQGCAPIADAFKEGRDYVIPVEHPKTIAHSIAIGDPGDGYYVLKIAKQTGGIVGSVSDEEIIEAIELLASTEGIFTEPAGGVVIGLLKKLAEEGKIKRDEVVVVCITGSGLKAAESVMNGKIKLYEIEPSLEAIRRFVINER